MLLLLSFLFVSSSLASLASVEEAALLALFDEAQCRSCPRNLSFWSCADAAEPGHRLSFELGALICRNGSLVSAALTAPLAALPSSLLRFTALTSLSVTPPAPFVTATDSLLLPSTLAALSQLRHLNLSGAGLLGLIPSQLSALSGLTLLDLSHNGFSGSVPLLSQALPACELRGNPQLACCPPMCACDDAAVAAGTCRVRLPAAELVGLVSSCGAAACGQQELLRMRENECYVLHQCLAPHLGVAGYARLTRNADTGGIALEVYERPACSGSVYKIAGFCNTCFGNMHVKCEERVDVAAAPALQWATASIVVASLLTL